MDEGGGSGAKPRKEKVSDFAVQARPARLVAARFGTTAAADGAASRRDCRTAGSMPKELQGRRRLRSPRLVVNGRTRRFRGSATPAAKLPTAPTVLSPWKREQRSGNQKLPFHQLFSPCTLRKCAQSIYSKFQFHRLIDDDVSIM